MGDLEIDLDEDCFLVTKRPDRRIGPILLRCAVRRVVDRRPQADEVAIETLHGIVLDKPEIEAIYALASLAMLGPPKIMSPTPPKQSESRAQP